MKEKLIIKNFGPIQHVELNLGRLNVLIGEQASGKSTVAKVLAVCRYYSYITPSRIEQALSNFSRGLAAWGMLEFVKRDSHIFYDCQHYTLTVNQEIPQFSRSKSSDDKEAPWDGPPIFYPELKPKSKEFKSLEYVKNEIFGQPRVGPAVLPLSFFQNNVAAVMDNPLYLPTERGLQSVFSLGKAGIQNLSDSLFNSFARLDQIFRNFNGETPIEPLGITYKNEDGRGYIRKNTGEEFYSLTNGASGYQTTIPIVLAVEYYQRIREKKKTFLIEESELSLFPTAQAKLIKYLVEKVMVFGNTVLITTHSPYTLTALNNCLYAFQVGVIKPSETEAILAKKYWLDPTEVSAYRLTSEGNAIDIFDQEIDQIDAGAIDGASRDINEEYDRLLKIEINGQ